MVDRFNLKGDKMKIGIFGGAFNPPHKMHMAIAKELIEKKWVDKVIFVPVADNYIKPNILKGIDRFKMLEIMTKAEDEISVSDFEIKGSLYSINLLNHFRDIYPKADIYFVCGTDNLKEFDTWKYYEDILNNYKLLVINRGSYKFEDLIDKYSKYKNRIICADNIKTINISSTTVREEILKNGVSRKKLSKYMVPEVISYLEKINYNEYWESELGDVHQKSKK